MKLRFFVFLFYSFFTSCIIAHNSQDNLILSQKPLLTFYDNQSIKINTKMYQHIIETWQQKFIKAWGNISSALYKKIKIIPQHLDEFLANNTFARLYIINKYNEISTIENVCISEKDAEPEVIHFIKKTLTKYCSKQNIKIFLTPYISTLTLTLGSDQDTHYLICNSLIYSSENIKHYYEAIASHKGLFNINITETNNINFIEISNLLLLGIIKAASHIEHQSDVLSYLISYLLYNNQIEENEIKILVKRYIQYSEIRSILEAIFQSKNPLESALYYAKNQDPSTREHKMFLKLSRDIAFCYHPKSLAKSKKITQELTTLYKDFG